ncbi:hypothetical protein KSP39_PZI024078 [Platanthera zijinensis]|uniref:Uncharacterized protein n=1 Tax=Platanthera zijinensis TaxID=2320716 RepID=A0AAP0AT70_9ASPA
MRSRSIIFFPVRNRRPLVREKRSNRLPCLRTPIPGAFVDGIRFREWIQIALVETFIPAVLSCSQSGG